MSLTPDQQSKFDALVQASAKDATLFKRVRNPEDRADYIAANEQVNSHEFSDARSDQLDMLRNLLQQNRDGLMEAIKSLDEEQALRIEGLVVLAETPE